MKHLLDAVEEALSLRARYQVPPDKSITSHIETLLKQGAAPSAYTALGTPEEIETALATAYQKHTAMDALVKDLGDKVSELQRQVEQYQKAALEAIDLPRMDEEEKTELSKAVSIVRDIKDRLGVEDDLVGHLKRQEAELERLKRDDDLHKQDSTLVQGLLDTFREYELNVSRNTLKDKTQLTLRVLDDSVGIKNMIANGEL